MNWHYQAMRHVDDGEEWIGIHEYYPMDDGHCWTESPVDVEGESVDDVLWMLNAIKNDIERYGVIDYQSETATQTTPSD